MKRERREKKTLFNSGIWAKDPTLPGSTWLSLHSDDDDARKFVGAELWAFQHAMEHEYQYYEQRGHFIGPLVWQVAGENAQDLGQLVEPCRMPRWVEADGLTLQSCSAAGILLVENGNVYEKLVAARAWKSANLLLALSSGLPRSGIRRLLHRITEQFQIPLYLLVDNSTWGYFIFSILKRGLLTPDATSDYLRISDLRYLGLFATDTEYAEVRASIARRWHPRWELRLNALRQYPCLQSPAWQAELELFSTRQHPTSLSKFIETIGSATFVQKWLAGSLEQERWLC